MIESSNYRLRKIQYIRPDVMINVLDCCLCFEGVSVLDICVRTLVYIDVYMPDFSVRWC